MVEEGEPLVAAKRAPYGKYAVAAALVVVGATVGVASTSRATALYSSAAPPRVRVQAYADAL